MTVPFVVVAVVTAACMGILGGVCFAMATSVPEHFRDTFNSLAGTLAFSSGVISFVGVEVYNLPLLHGTAEFIVGTVFAAIAAVCIPLLTFALVGTGLATLVLRFDAG